MYEMRRVTYNEGEKFMPPMGAAIVCSTSFQDDKGAVFVELWMAVPTDSSLYSGTPKMEPKEDAGPDMAFLSPKEQIPFDEDEYVDAPEDDISTDDVMFGPDELGDLDGLQNN